MLPLLPVHQRNVKQKRGSSRTGEEMQSWTESWLTEGCGPLGHTLIAIATEGEAPVLRCTRCARREIVGSETCLVCNNTGVERLRLFRIISNEPVATGKLCSTCAHELSSQTVAGWYALREDQPACLNGGESNRRAG